MARYTGPKSRIARKFGEGIFGADKVLSKKNYPPGQHGNSRKRKTSEYGVQLREKQKAKYTYGVLEKQFRNLFEKAATAKGITGEVLLQLLEGRLDNVVFRLGIAPTRAAARQLVGHKHITVDGEVVNIPSYAVKPGQLIGHNNKKLANRKSVKNAVLELQNSYQKYFEENKERICETNYTDETFETEKITLVSNPIHTGSKEPVVWYQLGELMKNAKNRVKIHTPYIICNDMMYNTWEEIAENVSDFSIMTNSVANNGNPFGAADYAKNRNRILSTGINIWEYEGGYSYHGKSILIDDDLSVIGSFNMDMRSAYLDTELMLVIRSKDINKQLEEGMMEYEKVSRQILEGGTYNDPYHVEPIELTKKRQRKIFLVQHLLGWARYLF